MSAGISEIYKAIESKLIAADSFTGYSFFRSESDKQSGKQNKAKAPFLRLVWLRENQRSAVSRQTAEKTSYYRLDVVANTSATDKDDIARVEQCETLIKSVENCIIRHENNDFIGLQYVRDIRIESAKNEIKDIATVELQFLSFEIAVDYFKRLG